MAIFLSCNELYEVIQKKSSEAKKILWVCSPSLELDAHEVFSQEILKQPPEDIRFIFKLNDNSVKNGKINPYEVQYFMERFKNSNIRSHENSQLNLFIFDDSALLTSANLTKAAFENSIEAGVLLEGPEAEQVKVLFNLSLWQTAKTVIDVKKFKKTWGLAQKPKTKEKISPKKTLIHTKIKDWTDDYVNKWYIGVPNRITAKTIRKIKKETSWPTRLVVVGDVGYPAFKHLKMGDLAYLAHLTGKRGKIEIEFARIFDKSRVETDEGDLHFACEVENNYLLEREQFYGFLKSAKISSRSSEVMLEAEQLNCLTNALSSIKHKRKRRLKKDSSP